jgi:hypothetical protein
MLGQRPEQDYQYRKAPEGTEFPQAPWPEVRQ